jgi:hypothetical protein
MMTSNNVKLNQPFPAAVGGGKGGILKLSQTQCALNPASCCNKKGTICTNWTGAHLVSAGCIQYGVLELEAAFDMPVNGGGFYFTATYIVYGSDDGAWNEIDIGMINNALNQLEFHATVFTANASAPTATLMDALNFAGAGIGTSVNINSPVKAINGVKVPVAYYDTAFASTMHTYKIVWSPTSVAWMVDTVVYRNITYAPWRPMSVRQILRTNRGNTLPMGSPDTNIYIRRIRYTPLSDRAISDAYRCSSMFACYGAMAPAPLANASMFVTLASTSAAAATTGRRALLATTAANSAALSAAVADSLAGVPETEVITVPSAFGLSFTINLQNLAPASTGSSARDTFQSDGLQTALLSGLSGDVSPGGGNILVEDVRESPDGLTVSVDVLVTGYTALDEVHADYARLVAVGAAAFDSAAAAVNNALGEVSSAYITPNEITNSAVDDAATPDFAQPTVAHPVAKDALLGDATKCPSYPDFFDATCVDDAGDLPSVWCAGCVLMDMTGLAVITTYTVSIPVAASAVDAFEAALDASLNSGTLGSNLGAAANRRRHLLQAGSTLNVSTTNSLVAQRLTTAAVLESIVCGEVESQLKEWRASAIAFIIAFGVLAVGTAVGCAFMAGKRAGQRTAGGGAAAPQSLESTPSKERGEALRVVAYEQDASKGDDCEAPGAQQAQ